MTADPGPARPSGATPRPRSVRPQSGDAAPPSGAAALLPPGRARWVAPMLLAALVGGLYFLRLGQDLPLRTHESLLAVTARNMALGRAAPVVAAPAAASPATDASTDAQVIYPSPWLVPNFNDQPRLVKTPLPYWTVAVLAQLRGGLVDEWTARLPSAAAAAGTVAILVALMLRFVGRRAAYLGGAALAASVGFVTMGREAQADMLMSFFTTASLAALWMAVEEGGRRRFMWLLATGAAGGLAMLAKGPAPLMVFAVPYGVAAVLMIVRLRQGVPPAACGPSGESPAPADKPLTRADKPPVAPGVPEQGSWAGWKWTLAGAAVSAAIFIAITVPWPLEVYRTVPGAYEIWKTESVDRSMGDLGHKNPIYFYLLRLPVLLAPWGICFGLGAVLAVVRALRRPAERPWLILAAAWLVGPLVGFSLSVGKSDYYILPILPAAAIFTALAFDWLLAPPTPRAQRAARLLLLAHGAAMALAGLAGVAIYALFRYDVSMFENIHGLQQYLRPAVFNAVLALGIVAAAGGAAAVASAVRGLPAASLAAMAVLFAVAYLLSWVTLQGPLDRAVTAAAFGRQIRAIARDVPVVAYVESNHTSIFYAQRAIPEVPTREQLAAMIAARTAIGRSLLVACDERHYAELSGLPDLQSISHKIDLWRPEEGFSLLEFGPKPPQASPTRQ